jgi:hypothetical protein
MVSLPNQFAQNRQLASHFCRISSGNGFAAIVRQPSRVCRIGFSATNAE